jgi:hypothetical protein
MMIVRIISNLHNLCEVLLTQKIKYKCTFASYIKDISKCNFFNFNDSFVEQMQTKGDALQTEFQLLSTFDYAWNTINNGPRRPGDILEMLNKISSSTRTFSDVAKSLLPFTQKKVGIPIKSSMLPMKDNKSDEADNGSYNFLSRVFKFHRSRHKIVQDTTDFSVEKSGKICGVNLDNSSICTKTPVEKRVRCHEHKGMRIRTSKSESKRGNACRY